jgi:hypothetical protein
MDRADDALRVADLAASMAQTPAEQAEAQSTVENIRQMQEYKRRVQEQQEAFKKTQLDSVEQARSEGSAQTDRPAPSADPSMRAESSTVNVAPSPVQRRDEPAAAGSGGVALEARALAPPPRPELLPTRQVADGIITGSACAGKATLELTLGSAAGTKQLYSDDYFKIPFSALSYTPEGILNPCSDLKGRHAHITYLPAKNHPEQGEVVGVELVK